MNIHREIQSLLYEYTRGELSATEQQRVGNHLATCTRCATNAAEIRELVKGIPTSAWKPAEDRSDNYWSSFSYNIINRIRLNDQHQRVPKISFAEYLRSMFVYQRRAFVGIGVGLAVIAVLVLTWQLQRSGGSGIQQLASGASENQTPTVQARYGQYLRQSQMLMVGLMNMKSESGERVDLNVERDLSRHLIQEARYLHDQDIDEHAKQLIRDLEKILIELANIEEQHDLPDVEILRAGIRQENLLFKIRMGEQLYPPPPKNQKEHQSPKGETL